MHLNVSWKPGQTELSGVWTISPRPYSSNIANDLKPGEVLPSAEALAKQGQENVGKDDLCIAISLPFVFTGVSPTPVPKLFPPWLAAIKPGTSQSRSVRGY